MVYIHTKQMGLYALHEKHEAENKSMKKFAGFKKVLDGINQINGGSSYTDGPVDNEINEKLCAEKFTLAKVGRYGLPYHATCIALDHVQKLLAIGTASGAIRICGKPGVECHVHHESNAAVNILLFLINEGGLVSVCSDASIHIWSIRQNQPALIQSLNFKKERVTAIHNPFGYKWLYVGTERGNVYIVNIETFRMSGYAIQWNHVIDVSCKHHPGPVVQIKNNPLDENKLILIYESGVCVSWDLRLKKYTSSYSMDQAMQYITCVCWNVDGKQFMTGHWNGGISIWNSKNKKPEETQLPHSSCKNSPKQDEPVLCCPVSKLEWYTGKEGDVPMVIFSGGMPLGNKNKGLTLMRGRSKNLILSDYVVDFQCLLSSPRPSDHREALALFVLLRNEIVVFDLCSSVAQSLPWFEIPYTFNIHETPVTCIQFFPDVPIDLLVSLHSLKQSNIPECDRVSKRSWPLTGGQDGEVQQAPSLIITGHADGCVNFWDASSNMLILCYKLNVSQLCERQVHRQSSGTSSRSKCSNIEYDDPFAIQHIQFCTVNNVLTVACQSFFLITFTFSTKENLIETNKIDANFTIELGQECEDSPTSLDQSFTNFNEASNLSQTSSVSGQSTSSLQAILHPPFRTTAIKWPPGFQPQVVIQQLSNESAFVSITSLTQSTAYGLVAFGNTAGVAIIDYLQKSVVMVAMNYELGVAGDWIDSSSSCKSSLSKANSSSVPLLPIEQVNCNNLAQKRKERTSRMFSNMTSDSHSKLKRHSSANVTASNIVRDHEDGLVKENVAGSIQSISFAYSYTKKSGTQVSPSLWVGTSLGNVVLLVISVPPSGEQRFIQPVMALSTDTHLDQRHCVLDMSHLDGNGNIVCSPCLNQSSNIASMESNVRQFLCVTTEKFIKVISLPSFKTYSRVDTLDEDVFVVKAHTMPVKGGNCVGCLTTDGFLKIYSLPRLRPLLDMQCGISLADYRMIRTFTFGKSGEAVFLCSPSEIQRVVFTKSKEKCFLDEQGSLFTPCELPQPKPKGFFESFFASSAVSTLDRDELFGPKSGTPSRNVAQHVPGSGIECFRGQSDNAASAVSKAKMMLIERGQNLSAVEEATARLQNRAQNFSSAAKALSDKYQRKKWYQL